MMLGEMQMRGQQATAQGYDGADEPFLVGRCMLDLCGRREFSVTYYTQVPVSKATTVVYENVSL